MSILILEICPHGPHYMICASNVSLKEMKGKLMYKLQRRKSMLLQIRPTRK